MIGSQFYDEDKQLPLATGFRRSTEPTFLLSRGDLLKRDPKLIFDNLSLHILDIGYGPITLLTFHRIDDEKDVQGNGNFLMIYICNFHVLSNLLLIYICKLHWNLYKVNINGLLNNKVGLVLLEGLSTALCRECFTLCL